MATSVLTRIDLADGGVIPDAEDGVVGRPRPLVADGALVGSVTGCSVWVMVPVSRRRSVIVRMAESGEKLHRWAAADPGRRFDDLFNFVHDPATLVVAFDRVAGNTGRALRASTA